MPDTPELPPTDGNLYRETALVRAVQFTRAWAEAHVFDERPLPDGVQMSSASYHPERRELRSAFFYIETLEGRMDVSFDDWIAGPGANGEYWPIKPDVFAATYEPAAILASRATRLAEAPKGWKPEFDAVSVKQERLALKFARQISEDGRRGVGMDPVCLLEMAQALYEAERDDRAPDAAPAASSPEAADERTDMCSVTREDANNYCAILSALGMEEEGDPVAEVKRLIAFEDDTNEAAALTSAPAGAGEGASLWRIEYGNDTGPSDEGFWEWWDVTDGERSYRANSKREAEQLRDLLNRAALAGEPAVAADEGRDALLAVGRTLADFAKTAPGRLPSRVQEAIDFIARAASQDEQQEKQG